MQNLRRVAVAGRGGAKRHKIRPAEPRKSLTQSVTFSYLPVAVQVVRKFPTRADRAVLPILRRAFSEPDAKAALLSASRVISEAQLSLAVFNCHITWMVAPELVTALVVPVEMVKMAMQLSPGRNE